MNEKPFYENEPLSWPFPFITWDSYKAPFWFPLHWHERVEILYILKGSFNAYISGAQWEGCQGDIIVVNTGLIHSFFDPSPNAHVRILQFGLEIFDEILIDTHDWNLQGPVFSRRSLVTASQDGRIHTRLEKLIMDIFEEFHQKNPGYRLAIKSKLYELAVIFLREISTEAVFRERRLVNKKNSTQHLERIFSLMLESFDDPDFSLEDIARGIGLSKFHLSRFLKKQTGQGFHDHLTRIRLRQAEKYLVESNRQVADIAYTCGFQSLTTFNRLFKAYTGTSPSIYRNGKNTLLPYEK